MIRFFLSFRAKESHPHSSGRSLPFERGLVLWCGKVRMPNGWKQNKIYGATFFCHESYFHLIEIMPVSVTHSSMIHAVVDRRRQGRCASVFLKTITSLVQVWYFLCKV